MKLIITGASGNYGQMAVAGLLASGVPPGNLTVISRTPEKLSALGRQGLHVQRGDFDDFDTLVKAFQGGDKLLLISTGRVGRRIPQHKNAIDAARQAGVRHVVYTSFVGIGKDNPALVVKDHTATEELLRKSGLYWTALRDSQYSEAMLEAAAPLMVTTGRWQVAAAEGKIAFVTRRDCVACAVAVMSTSGHENRVYNITGPELLSFREVASLTADISGHPVKYEVVDDAGLYAMFDALGVPREAVDDQVVARFPWCSDDMVSFECAVRNGHMAVISNDVERLTGRKPTSLRDFFTQHRTQLQDLRPPV